MTKRLNILLMILLFIPPFVEAEEEVTKLEEVSVTATRTERTTEEIPAGVSIVTREDIKNTRMFGIKEALTGVAGVQSESRNGGYDARLIIRGAGLKASYGVREIMVLLDGVPITEPDGMTRLDFIDTQLVERVDIVKGPNSTLYGANAVGGVINVITKSPFEEAKGVKLGYGSYDTQMYNLVYGTRVGNTYLTLTGSRRYTDGWREWNEFTTNQGSIKLGYIFDEESSIEANITYTEADLQLPGTLTKTQFDEDITQLTSDIWRHMGRYSDILYTSLKFEKGMGDLTFKPILYFQTWEHYHPVTGSIVEGGADVYGADLQVDLRHDVYGMEGTLTTGITGQIDEGDTDRYTYRDYVTGAGGRISYTLSDSKGELAETDDDTTTKWGIFLQESLRPSDKWIIDLGLRYDQVDFDIYREKYKEYSYSSGKYVTSRETIKRDKTFDHVSPRIGVVYKLTEDLNLYGNISIGFQTPSIWRTQSQPRSRPIKGL